VNNGKKTFLYSHKNKYDTNQFEMNCFGLINYLLSTCEMTLALKEIQDFNNTQNPVPIHYVDFFNSNHSKQWTIIDDASHLKPGDIIAYKSNNSKPDIGQHIMIVADFIEINQSSHITVPIIDSTKILHGPDDTRLKNGGIGQSNICIELHNHKWDRLKWYPNGKTLYRTIAMARLKG
jgi:hypothetical protein